MAQVALRFCVAGAYETGMALGRRRLPVAALCVTGVALGDIDLRLAWRGTHGSQGTGPGQ